MTSDTTSDGAVGRPLSIKVVLNFEELRSGHREVDLSENLDSLGPISCGREVQRTWSDQPDVGMHGLIQDLLLRTLLLGIAYLAAKLYVSTALSTLLS